MDYRRTDRTVIRPAATAGILQACAVPSTDRKAA